MLCCWTDTQGEGAAAAAATFTSKFEDIGCEEGHKQNEVCWEVRDRAVGVNQILHARSCGHEIMR